MQEINQRIISQTLHSKKEIMQMKRLKAKQKSNASSIKMQTKQDLRKQKNRHAAQKSRDKRKQYLQTLQNQNQRLKNIIAHCEICSALELSNRPEQRINQHSEEPILINLTPHTVFNETLIREQNSNEEISSNLSQYFWLGCILVLIVFANYQSGNNQNARRQLFSDIQVYLPKVQFNNTSNSKPRGILENSKALVQKNPNYCQLCMECLKNISSKNNGNISLLGNQTTEVINKNTTNKILYCKSRAKFFQKIYQALSEKAQQNKSRQITRVLIKGKLLNDMMEQDCFLGQQINEEEQYLISFSLAILQMAPVKASRKSRLSVHNDD